MNASIFFQFLLIKWIITKKYCILVSSHSILFFTINRNNKINKMLFFFYIKEVNIIKIKGHLKLNWIIRGNSIPWISQLIKSIIEVGGELNYSKCTIFFYDKIDQSIRHFIRFKVIMSHLNPQRQKIISQHWEVKLKKCILILLANKSTTVVESVSIYTCRLSCVQTMCNPYNKTVNSACNELQNPSLTANPFTQKPLLWRKIPPLPA